MLNCHLAGIPPEISLRPSRMDQTLKVLAPFIILTIGQVLANETRGLSRGSPRLIFNKA